MMKDRVARRRAIQAAAGASIAAALAGQAGSTLGQDATPTNDGTPAPGTPMAGTPGAGTPAALDTRYTGGTLTDADRDLLAGYAAATWDSFAAMVGPTGLPTDRIERQPDGSWVQVPQTSPTNIGSYLWAIVVAEELGFIDQAEAIEQTERVVTTLGGMERYEGFYYNWYGIEDGQKLTTWPGSRRTSTS